jgi:uncharacterized RDD family membrane protein YckC
VNVTRGPLCKVVTPEGLPLEFEIADVPDRVAAFIIDLLLIALGILVVFVAGMVASLDGGGVVLALALLAAFLLKQFYFLIFELRNSGTTPGKRQQRLRVIARDGGPLTAEMIVARNLVREVEFFLPIIALAAPEALFPAAGWTRVVASLWLFVFLLMPFFNRFRLRCGDLIAGTVVIRQPVQRLLDDVAHESTRVRTGAPRETFTIEELSYYGAKELQVLEDLFRRHRDGRATDQLLSEVASQIARKINRPPVEPGEARQFLEAFYREQRRYLEQKLLWGIRKETKTASESPTPRNKSERPPEVHARASSEPQQDVSPPLGMRRAMRTIVIPATTRVSRMNFSSLNGSSNR